MKRSDRKALIGRIKYVLSVCNDNLFHDQGCAADQRNIQEQERKEEAAGAAAAERAGG